jgi:hypothetical protein
LEVGRPAQIRRVGGFLADARPKVYRGRSIEIAAGRQYLEGFARCVELHEAAARRLGAPVAAETDIKFKRDLLRGGDGQGQAA